MNPRYEKASALYRRKQFSEALAVLTGNAGREDAEPLSAQELILLSNVYEAEGRHLESLETLQRIISTDPGNGEAWNNIGVVCQNMRRMDEAKMAFERAYRVDPGKANVLVNLGALHLKLSDPEKAKEYLELALQLDASHAAAHANLAITLAMFGRLEEAEESLRIAVLYGFNDADPIQERIGKMKGIRQSILERQSETDIPLDAGATPDEQEARAMLMQKERLLFMLVKQEHDAVFHSGEPNPEYLADTELEGQIAALRMEVREMRRAFELPEISEMDMFMGENYMMTSEEKEQLSGEISEQD